MSWHIRRPHRAAYTLAGLFFSVFIVATVFILIDHPLVPPTSRPDFGHVSRESGPSPENAVSARAASRSSRAIYVSPLVLKRPRLAAATAGYSPSQIRHAYGIDRVAENGAGQIIAMVSAYDNPTLREDLQTFDQTFQLPGMHGLTSTDPCTVQRGPHPCFQRIAAANVHGGLDDWVTESALGVEWSHVVATGADILLIETPDSQLATMTAGVDQAVKSGASVVAMSWGTPEFAQELLYDSHFQRLGVVFVAPTGDNGAGVLYPAASPYVLAVGGTSLSLGPGDSILSERAWLGSGGGVSAYEAEPAYQSRLGILTPTHRRATPDVAYAADPDPGYAVYSASTPDSNKGWFQLAGTSAAVPQWAGIVALANQRRHGDALSIGSLANSPFYTAASSSNGASSYFDVVSGRDGDCKSCHAGPGFDLVTGLGSPRVDRLVSSLAGHAGG